jgi:hypothetical protein
MKKQKLYKEQNLKSIVLISLGTMGVFLYIILKFKDILLGRSGFFILAVAIILIIEGFRTKNGKESFLFPKFIE